jgi:predicted nucleotidyltransferase
MLDFARTDRRLLDEVGVVVDELVERAGLDPDSIMLIGAQCRDAIHSALGHASVNRVTNDLDVGVALSDWTAFERVDSAFQRIGSNGIRYSISEIPVDVMPFGSIEEPSGIVRPISRQDGVVVFGFEDVFKRALRVDLPGAGHRIRAPSPAGYAALKIRAWVDRSVYGEYKDAEDLATVMRWYDDWDVVQERLYEGESNVADHYGYDMPLAAACLLGLDVRSQLTTGNAQDLALRFGRSDTDRFAAAVAGEPGNPARRSEITAAL